MVYNPPVETLETQSCYWSLLFDYRDPFYEPWLVSFSVHQQVETPAGATAIELTTLGRQPLPGTRINIPSGNKPIFYRILGDSAHPGTEVTVVGFGRYFSMDDRLDYELWQWKPEEGLLPCARKYQVPKLIIEQIRGL